MIVEVICEAPPISRFRKAAEILKRQHGGVTCIYTHGNAQYALELHEPEELPEQSPAEDLERMIGSYRGLTEEKIEFALNYLGTSPLGRKRREIHAALKGEYPDITLDNTTYVLKCLKTAGLAKPSSRGKHARWLPCAPQNT